MAKKKHKDEPDALVQQEVEVAKNYVGAFPAQVTFNISAISQEKALVALHASLLAMNLILKGQIKALTQPVIGEVN